MPTVNPSPLGVKMQKVLTSGLPAVGNLLFSYVAGSVSTKQSTYTDSTGSVANANPIVLDSLGQIPLQVWLASGQLYKFVYAPATDTDPPTSPIWSIDGLSGINDSGIGASGDQWVASGITPTFVSSTSFTLPGDQTIAFSLGRRVKATVSSGTVYGIVVGSVFGAVTTVTLFIDELPGLDAGLSAVSYGLLSVDTVVNSGVPANYAMPLGVFADYNGWVLLNVTPTFVSATQFTVPVDVSFLLTPGRALKINDGASFAWVTVSAFGGAITTVTVQNADGATLNSSLRAVSYSAIGGEIVGGLRQSFPSQITFPPTQIASTNVNTIDDYEEGTWTPVLTFATPGNLVVAYTNQYGGYIKIGRQVTVWFDIVTSTFTHTTASGACSITGQPFTSETLAGTINFVGTCGWQGITKAGYTQVYPKVTDNATTIDILAAGSAQAVAAVAAADMPTAGTVHLRGCVTFLASA